jgi:hypothetical protein
MSSLKIPPVDIDEEITRVTNHLKVLDGKNYNVDNNPVYKAYSECLEQLKDIKKR